MSAYPEERPPRVGLKVLGRASLAALLIVALCAGAVAFAVIREVENTVEPFTKPGRTLAPIPEIDRAAAGGARTIMVLGSDKREGVDAGSPPRADTILLVRADPDKSAIAVMSIPRDLAAEIPGVGESKINFAYEKGRARLTVRTVKKLFQDATGKKFPINNVIIANYDGFKRAVNYIGGVYVDIDRDYFNDNSSGLDNYATIDVDPGYQKLTGRDALDYVRYRHGDNDLVRAARQQDFLRQAKNAAGLRKLMSLSDLDHLARVFARYFQVDKTFTETKEIFSMIRLGLFLAQEETKINEVRFPVTEAENPQLNSNLYTSDADLRKVFRKFMNMEASAKPRETTESAEQERKSKRKREKREREPGPVEGLVDITGLGEGRAVVADPELDFPFYYPTVAVTGAQYALSEPRLYRIRDETGKKHDAYRLVFRAPGIGEYYGVQGMTWRAPPILDNPDRTVRRGGRKLKLFYDGESLRLVAWRTKRAVYWISNTLTQSVEPEQMLAIASSLRRLGR